MRRRMENKMKNIIILLCMLSIPTLSFAENLVLLRKDKESTSYYEQDTIRRTQQLALAWTIETKYGKKYSEYLTEFNCKEGTYRPLLLRIFAADSELTSVDLNATYKKWYNVPPTTQILGILFSKICTGN